jgi:DNA-binding transcriptional ArsR family regulator
MIPTSTSCSTPVRPDAADDAERGWQKGPAAVTELAGPTGFRLPTILRHLSVLEEAGLVATQKDGRVRSCAFQPQGAGPDADWLEEQRKRLGGAAGPAGRLCDETHEGTRK